MYKDYYGFTADPFRLMPDAGDLYMHPSFKKSLSYIQYALYKGEGIVLITGQSGIGKTALISKGLQEQADYELIFTLIDCAHFNGLELMNQFAASCGLRTTENNTLSGVYGLLNQHLRAVRQQGKRSVLLLDEAHLLEDDALEAIHLLSNLHIDGNPLVQIFLIGQPELKARLLAPGLEQLHQRIIATSTIEALNKAETQGYILQQLTSVQWKGNPGIAETVFTAIHSASLGIPRWINLICSRMMVQAVASDRHLITLEDICEVLNDLLSEDLLPERVRLANKQLT